MSEILESFREEVEASIKVALEMMGAGKVELAIETPPDEKMGDLAVPCFPLAKVLRKSPQAIATEIAGAIKTGGLVSRIETSGPYVNFFMDREKLKEEVLRDALGKKERYGHLEAQPTRVLIEHTSANPTGPLHIGRARNPVIGDSITRILRMAGYNAVSEFYVNDVGKQVVILSYGVKYIKPEGEPERDKDDYRLVLNYQAANKRMEEDPAVLDEINGMLYDLEHGDPETVKLVRSTCGRVLNATVKSLADINIKIDQFTWESKFIQEGQVNEIIGKLKKSPLCKETEDGAFALDLESYGIHGEETDFIFTRKDGTSLYTTRDLAYHQDKFKRCDIAIDVLGEDQKLGQQQLGAAMDILGEKRRPDYIFYAFVSLPEGRMSTRKGTVVYLDDLVEEAIGRALAEVKKRRQDISEEEMAKIARIVAVGAVRFNIARIQGEKQIVFKWEEALNFEGNSAPFVQYAYARASSILRKASDEGVAWKEYDPSVLSDKHEINLLKAIGTLPIVVDQCAEERKVHPMAQYALELATLFNQFYQFVPVLKAEQNEKKARLALVEAARWSLRNSLESLGIDVPEEM
jgi:arginyl-tRNA synthetase